MASPGADDAAVDEERRANKLKKLPLSEYPTRPFSAIVVGTAFLSAVGGYINGISYAGLYKSGLTHLTGTSTLTGVRAVIPPPEGNYQWTASVLGTFIIAYTLGSTVAGYILPDGRFKWRGRQGMCFVFSSVSLYIAYALKSAEATQYEPSGAWFILFAAGVQSAVTSVLSGITIRTANVTGTACDIGIALGQTLAACDGRSLYKLYLWTPSLLCFIFGAMIGAAVWKEIETDSLLVAAVIHTLIALVSLGRSAHYRWSGKAEQVKRARRQLSQAGNSGDGSGGGDGGSDVVTMTPLPDVARR